MNQWKKNQMKKNRSALLVGAGHVGKRHALKLSKLFNKLYIIDPNQTALDWCKNNIKNKIELFNDFDKFNSNNINNVAKDGMLSTKDIIATKGRASFLGERAKGHIDPGARSSQLAIEAICNQFINK